MNKLNLAKFTKQTKRFLIKHQPEILTGVGIAGMLTTTVLAVKATPKAIRLLEEKKEELEVDTLTPVETVKATWKCYIPAALTGVASTACLIGSSSINVRRNAALTAAYKLSETALSEYKSAVVETIGEKKEHLIHDKIAEKQIERNPIDKSSIIITEKGNTLCFDPFSGRYFKSDIDKIRKAENTLNKQILTDAFGEGVSLNDFYDELGLPHTKRGYEIGWNVDNLVEIYLSAQIAGEETEYEGTPCIVIEFTTPPKYDF